MSLESDRELEALREKVTHLSEELRSRDDLIDWYREGEATRTQQIVEFTQEIEDMRSEIARHHRDFERWEDMADQGAGRIHENKLLKLALKDLYDMLNQAVEDDEPDSFLHEVVLPAAKTYINAHIRE